MSKSARNVKSTSTINPKLRTRAQRIATIKSFGEEIEAENARLMAAVPVMRTFASGALRDSEDGKLDFDGFLSPQALEAFAQYMHFHRQMPDGTLRASDNWQKGIPPDVLMKSAWRHFFALWSGQRGYADKGFPNALANACGVLFNIQALIKHFVDRDGEAISDMLDVLAHERIARAKATKP